MNAKPAARVDLLLLASMVDESARVLDVGCGDGELLRLLSETKSVDARGVEISQKGVNDCVAKGLSVVQGDADVDLADYPTDGFDYVILSQTLQATRNPKTVLEQMLRIGKRAIVSFPNFGHWRVRWDVGVRGRMPVTENLSFAWYETPNIHFCTIGDFVALAELVDARILKAMALNSDGAPIGFDAPWWVWNLLGVQAVFLLERSGKV
jgi:methionine biosynthesis protein MetW